MSSIHYKYVDIVSFKVSQFLSRYEYLNEQQLQIDISTRQVFVNI